eukprot:15230696-Alexandrium_andersonii.AAC.1
MQRGDNVPCVICIDVNRSDTAGGKCQGAASSTPNPQATPTKRSQGSAHNVHRSAPVWAPRAANAARQGAGKVRGSNA